MTMTDDELAKLNAEVVAMATRINNALNAEIEEILHWAAKSGVDLAISDVDLDSDDARIWYVALEPGEKPPSGRAWRVYETSKGLPDQ
jgi:hypothetical protein